MKSAIIKNYNNFLFQLKIKKLDKEYNDFLTDENFSYKSLNKSESLNYEYNNFLNDNYLDEAFNYFYELFNLKNLNLEEQYKNILHIIFNICNQSLLSKADDILEEYFLNKKETFSKKDLIILLTKLKSIKEFNVIFDRILIKELLRKRNLTYVKFLSNGNEGNVFEISENLVVKTMNVSNELISVLDYIINNPINSVVFIKEYLIIDNILFVVMEKLKPLSREVFNDIKLLANEINSKFKTNYTNLRLTHIFTIIEDNISFETENPIYNEIIEIFKNLIDSNIFNSDIKPDSFMMDYNNKLTLIDIVSNYVTFLK